MRKTGLPDAPLQKADFLGTFWHQWDQAGSIRAMIFFRFCFCCLLGFATGLARAEVVRLEITRAYVEDAAQKLAATPYKPRRADLPDFLRDMSNEDYRRIRFIPEHALWRGNSLPFQVQFAHPGGRHRTPVGIQEFTDTHVQAIPFVRTFFDYQNLPFVTRLPPSLDYAGFRVLYQLQAPNRWDEVISFFGPNGFRAVAKGQNYGLSTRGIALNAGGPGAEEFPDFVMFWLGKPLAGATTLTFYGLLDGPSLTGAYSFVLTPGDETIVEVHAKLFFRQDVANLLLAPLSSMFWFGENSDSRHGDFRSEVHDSDGLLVAPEGDARWWRALTNPKAPRLTDFPAASPVGFGLLQRDRDFHDYEDTEARYDRRPGVWVEPVGRWPEGRVRLLEVPTQNEFVDNILAGWSPLVEPKAGQAMEFGYRLRWTNAPSFGGPSGWVRATRQTVQEDPEHPKLSRFLIDFGSAELEKIPVSAALVGRMTVPDKVKLISQRTFRNEVNGTWRYSVVLDGSAAEGPVELRAQLNLEGKPFTETWVGAWEP